MKTTLVMLSASFVAVLGGCTSGGASPAEQAQLKQQFSQKQMDINQVPPNERQMVQGYIDRAKAMRAGANPPKGQ